MTREEAKEFLIDISYKFGNMSIEYLTEKDGEKMREAIKALEQESKTETEDSSTESSTESSTDSTESSTESSTVSLGVFEQVKWERDVALGQLEELGYDLGEKIRTDEDCISRSSIKQKLQEHHDFFVNAYGGFSNLPPNDKSRVDEISNCIAMVINEQTVKQVRNSMVISIIEYSGVQRQIECESFEFRCNHVTNWIKIKKSDGSEEIVKDVCVIKTVQE